MTKLKTRLLKDLPVKTTPVTDDDYVINTNSGTTKLKVKDITKHVENKVEILEDNLSEFSEHLDKTLSDIKLQLASNKNILSKKPLVENAILTSSGSISRNNDRFDIIATKLKEGKSYTISVDNKWFYLILSDTLILNGNTFHGYIKNSYYDSYSSVNPLCYTITAPRDCFLILAWFKDETKQIMVEEGSDKTEYIEFNKTFEKNIDNINNASKDYSIFTQAYIKNCMLVGNKTLPNSANVVAKYTFVDMINPARRVKAKVRYFGECNFTLLATPKGKSKVSDITTTSLHIGFAHNVCRVQYFNRPTEPNIVDVQSFSYPTLDLTGQTEYEIGWQLADNTLTVYLPDGTTRTITNEKFQQVNGRYVCYEHYCSAIKGQDLSAFTRFDAMSQQGDTLFDDFRRFDGAIGIAPTGHIYSQFKND